MMKRIREAIKRCLSNNDKGFTLVELLVVIVILGILAAVVIPRFTTSTQTARDGVNDANIKIIESAAERYYVEHDDTYPATINALAPDYIKEVPTHPNGGTYTIDTDTGVVSD